MTPDDEVLDFIARRFVELLATWDKKSHYTYYSYYLRVDAEHSHSVLKRIFKQIQEECEQGAYNVQNSQDQVL